MIVTPRLYPFLIAIAACLGLAAFAGYDLYRERELAVSTSRDSTANLARLLEEQMRQALSRVQATLQVGIVRVARTGMPSAIGNSELRQQLQALLPADGLVHGLELIDGSGRSVVSTLPPDGGVQAGIADREWFADHLRAPATRLVIGRLEKDRSGRWNLPVSMRIERTDGGLDGVLLALVDTGTVQKTFDALDTGSNGFVTLFLSKGWLVVTSPANEALFDRNWRDTPMFMEHLPRAATGTVQQVVVRDRTERVYSYRALSDFPVVVSIGISLTDALADWRARFAWNAILLAAIAFSLLGAAAVLARHYERRDAAERALAEGARQTRAIVDHVADGIVTFNSSGKIESINPAAEAMFGGQGGQFLGGDIALIVPGLTWPRNSAEQADPVAADSSADQRTEAQGRHRDGHSFPVEIALTSGSRDGRSTWIALIRDITEGKKAEAVIADARRQAEQSERFLRQVTDNVPLRIAYVDSQLRYQFVNEAHCRRFGLPREAVIGRTRQELTHEQTAPSVVAELQRVLQGEPRRFEFAEAIDGQSIIIESHVVPDIGADGDVRGFYAASADVTDRHQQQRRIELALAERETLLREVYHRVKNNLQVIQSLLSLQQRALPPGEARAALDDSVQRVRAMALVHEKLYETGSLSAVNLSDYTRDLLAQIGNSAGAHARGILIRSEVVQVEAGLDVSMPYGLLVAELVGNSLKHGFPPGRGGEVLVLLQRVGPHLRLQVSDDGVSLPADFMLDQARSMGLQLAASLATQLGGTLQAHNMAGAVFTADLPRLG